MVQAADFRDPDDHAELRPLDRPSVGYILAEGEMLLTAHALLHTI